MPRICIHSPASSSTAESLSIAEGDCLYCKMPKGKWETNSCVWRDGEEVVRGIPPSSLSDFDALYKRVLEIRKESSEGNGVVGLARADFDGA